MVMIPPLQGGGHRFKSGRAHRHNSMKKSYFSTPRTFLTIFVRKCHYGLRVTHYLSTSLLLLYLLNSSGFHTQIIFPLCWTIFPDSSRYEIIRLNVWYITFFSNASHSCLFDGYSSAFLRVSSTIRIVSNLG